MFVLIIGGDFNTVINLGPCGDLLNELMVMFDLQIDNSDEFVGNEHQWTFCSYGGIKRRVDFVLHGPSMITTASAPSDFFDLCSDHRAVSAFFLFYHHHYPNQLKEQESDKSEDGSQ